MDFNQSDPLLMIVTDQGGSGIVAPTVPDSGGSKLDQIPFGFDPFNPADPLVPPIFIPEGEMPVDDPFKMPPKTDIGTVTISSDQGAIPFDGSETITTDQIAPLPKSNTERVAMIVLAAVLGFILFKFLTKGK